MNTPRTFESKENGLSNLLGQMQLRPGMIFGVIILIALIAFEIFNFSTTDYALKDLLGDLKFAGIQWATILAIAFCGIDFAGVARLFTPSQGGEETKEVWYLFGAWFLAATMNAVLTWWGVAMAISSHAINSSTVVDPSTLTKVIPIFVALMVWVIRILIIGSLSIASEHLFGSTKRPAAAPVRSIPSRPRSYSTQPTYNTQPRTIQQEPMQTSPSLAAAPRKAPQRPAQAQQETRELEHTNHGEPTYHSLTPRAARAANRPNGNGNMGENSQRQM